MTELYRRIIPKIMLAKDIKGDLNAVTTSFYRNFHSIGKPVSQAKIFQANIADELILLNVDKRSIKFSALLTASKHVSEEVFMPLSVGGGIETLDHAMQLFEIGVEKVVLDSIFDIRLSEVARIANRFGSQSLIGSCTYWGEFGSKLPYNSERRFLRLNEVLQRIKVMEASGVGEIMLNDASRDGSRRGSNLEVLNHIFSNTTLPVIDSCGFGKTSHFRDSFLQGSSAVAVGSYFAYVDQSILQLRSQLANYGVRVRTK